MFYIVRTYIIKKNKLIKKKKKKRNESFKGPYADHILIP